MKLISKDKNIHATIDGGRGNIDVEKFMDIIGYDFDSVVEEDDAPDDVMTKYEINDGIVVDIETKKSLNDIKKEKIKELKKEVRND